MLTLGIETSGRTGSVALDRDGECVATRELESAGRRHAQTLVAEIDIMLKGLGLRWHACDAVAVSIGPGSFTGLRVGVVCAKTMAWATGGRLAAVDTFEAIAAASPDDVAAIDVISDAQRGEIYAGHFSRDENGHFRRIGEISIENAEQWCGSRAPGTVIGSPDVERIAMLFPDGCRLLPAGYGNPSATTVARLGSRQIAQGQFADPWRLEPFYLRKSAAEEKWEATFDGGSGGGRL
jgi:tRNA threonylcarbamoyladenosine biosynthesis protein TsaB